MTKTKAPKVATFGDYLASAGDLPEDAFVGVLAWFTITKRARVTPAEIEQRFATLDLDTRYLPSPLTAASAFRKATGPEATVRTYRLPDGNEARILFRSLPSDRETMTRVIVRERVDAAGKRLDHVEAGRIVFYKAGRGSSERVRFTVHGETDTGGPLQTGERPLVTALCDEINHEYETYKTYLYDQPLRQMVREYVVGLNAVSVRPSGGLYFLHRSRWDEVRRLTTLVEGLHEGCTFVTAPLMDLPEMREMLIDAFQDEIVDEVTKLVGEVTDLQAAAKAGKTVTPEMVSKYGETVRGIASRAEEHTRVLEVSQDRTAGALESAWMVLAGLTEVMS